MRLGASHQAQPLSEPHVVTRQNVCVVFASRGLRETEDSACNGPRADTIIATIKSLVGKQLHQPTMQTNLRKLQGTLTAFHAAGIAIARECCIAVFPVDSGMVNAK